MNKKIQGIAVQPLIRVTTIKKASPEVLNWAKDYFTEQKEVLILLKINSADELVERLLTIPRR